MKYIGIKFVDAVPMTAGVAVDGSVEVSGEVAQVWSAMLDIGSIDCTQVLLILSERAALGNNNYVYRYFGLTVRGVIDKKITII